MYRPQAQQHVERHTGDNNYDDDSDIDEELVAGDAAGGGGADDQDVVTTMEDPVAGNYGGQGEETGKHVDTNILGNFQQLFLDVDVDASPEQLAANPKLAEFHLKEEVHKHFKENLSDKDRANASDDKLVGNVRTIVPLGLEVVEHQNTMPYKMQLSSNKHFVGKTVHRAGNAIWTVMPDTSPTPVGRVVFEPANIFDERMYNKAKMCTMQDIDEDIKMTSATKARAGFATVATGTAAHDRLKKGLDNGEWHKIHLSDAEWNDIFDPPRRSRTINVPLALGEALKADLRSDLQEVIDRCINLEDFVMRLERADGSKFNAPQGLHGLLVGGELDDGSAMATQMMQTNKRCHVRLLFTFRAI